jgi:hypothetical protein
MMFATLKTSKIALIPALVLGTAFANAQPTPLRPSTIAATQSTRSIVPVSRTDANGRSSNTSPAPVHPRNNIPL